MSGTAPVAALPGPVQAIAIAEVAAVRAGAVAELMAALPASAGDAVALSPEGAWHLALEAPERSMRQLGALLQEFDQIESLAVNPALRLLGELAGEIGAAAQAVGTHVAALAPWLDPDTAEAAGEAQTPAEPVAPDPGAKPPEHAPAGPQARPGPLAALLTTLTAMIPARPGAPPPAQNGAPPLTPAPDPTNPRETARDPIAEPQGHVPDDSDGPALDRSTTIPHLEPVPTPIGRPVPNPPNTHAQAAEPHSPVTETAPGRGIPNSPSRPEPETTALPRLPEGPRPAPTGSADRLPPEHAESRTDAPPTAAEHQAGEAVPSREAPARQIREAAGAMLHDAADGLERIRRHLDPPEPNHSAANSAAAAAPHAAPRPVRPRAEPPSEAERAWCAAQIALAASQVRQAIERSAEPEPSRSRGWGATILFRRASDVANRVMRSKALPIVVALLCLAATGWLLLKLDIPPTRIAAGAAVLLAVVAWRRRAARWRHLRLEIHS